MNSFASWYPAPDRLGLEDDEVHVWRVALDRASSVAKRFLDILTTDEQHRADRFRFVRDREHFIITRGMLRTTLGYYLKVEPERLRFHYNRYGKPALAVPSGGKDLRFNVSRSGQVALYAFSIARELGIDIELIREDENWDAIAERFFSRLELETLHSLPHDARVRAFFNCWTRKEAYLKARGLGLSLPLDGFSVSLAPNEPAALLATDEDAQSASNWSLEEITVGGGYVAALAVEGSNYHLTHWEWP
jgi:4'-phosphopantetheinyl transferase